VARADVPVCRLRERVGEAARRVAAEGWPLAVVVNDEGVVLGRIRASTLAADPDAMAEDVMISGPRTTRGRRPAADMAAWLDTRRVPGVIITTAEGVLIGYLRREDV
jgi:hypothetical protein